MWQFSSPFRLFLNFSKISVDVLITILYTGLSYKNKEMSYFKFIVLLTHPKLATLALPHSTSREGGRPLADVG